MYHQPLKPNSEEALVSFLDWQLFDGSEIVDRIRRRVTSLHARYAHSWMKYGYPSVTAIISVRGAKGDRGAREGLSERAARVLDVVFGSESEIAPALPQASCGNDVDAVWTLAA